MPQSTYQNFRRTEDCSFDSYAGIMSFSQNVIPQWVTVSPGNTSSEDSIEVDGNYAMEYPFHTSLGYFTAPDQYPVSIGGSQAVFSDPLFAYGAAGVTMPAHADYQLESDSLRSQESNIFHLEDDSEVQETGSACANEDGSKTQGRKRPPRKYTAEQLAKRREQNRKAQRTYRDRKDQRIKELEDELAAAAQHTEMMSSAINVLKAEYESLTGNCPVSMAGGEYYTPLAGSPPTTMI